MTEQGYSQISFQLLSQQVMPFSYCPGMAIIFSLHGANTVLLSGKNYTLRPGGFIVVNPAELYHIDCMHNAGAVVMRISPEFLRLCDWDMGKRVACYAVDATANPTFDRIRTLYAQMFQTAFQQQDGGRLQLAGLGISLLTLLRERFLVDSTSDETLSSENIARLGRILERIHQNWSENISIAQLAGEEYLSASYLSHFFSRHLHMTFTEYVVSVRLEHAVQDLADPTLSVAAIAYQNGFKSANSFIAYFRKAFGQTPGQYRKSLQQHRSEQGDLAAQEDQALWMQQLLQYADRSGQEQVQPEKKPARIQRITADTARTGHKLARNWRTLLNIGYAHDGLIGEVQRQILRAQEEIGFQYLRFHGIFDDDMHIYREQTDGTPQFNFYNVDLLFDFILSAGLTPFVELGYMPRALAKTQEYTVDRVTCKSMYRHADQWSALLQAFLSHIVERYGLQMVREWKFSSIALNYAYLSYYPNFSVEEYYEWYRVTYSTLKEFDGELQFGGPGGFASLLDEKQAINGFLAFAVEAGYPPDFFTIQCYPHQCITEDDVFSVMNASQQSIPSVLSGDVDFTRHTMERCRELLCRYGLGDREIYVEEWNSTLWQRDLSGDSCYKAAWLIKNICENFDTAQALGYWLLTDYIEEHADIHAVFHGGYGLFTYNGIPKAGYQALRLLSRMGNERVDSGDGWFLSRSESGFQLMLYHYCHYDNLYRYRYRRLTDPRDAYRVFVDDGALHFWVELKNLPRGAYRMERYTITRSSGSAFDCWVDSGAPSHPNAAEMRYITETAQPAYQTNEVITGDTLTVECILQPHEVQLIILKEKDRFF